MMIAREIEPKAGNQIGLHDVGRVLVGSWRRILCFAVAAGAVATIAVQAVPRTYTATTLVIYDPVSTINLSQSQRSLEPSVEMNMRMESQIEVITSAPVAERVIRKLELVDDPEFLPLDQRDTKAAEPAAAEETITAPTISNAGSHTPMQMEQQRIQATVPRFLSKLSKRRVGRSTVMEIRFTSQDAEKAVRIVNAVAEAYIDFDLDQKSEALRRGSDWLQARLHALRKQSFDSLGQVERFKRSGQGTVSDASVHLAELESTAQTYRRLYEGVHLQLMETLQRISYPVADARILSLATVSRVSSQPKKPLIIAFAAALGAALGVILSMIRVSQDGLVRTQEDLARAGLPLLGRVVPKSHRWHFRIRRRQRGSGPKALRELSQLRLDTVRSIDRSFGTGIRCLGICGLGTSGSPAVVSILLAKRYSRLGKRVLVVDARPNERTTSRLMAPEQDRGLADVLVERDGLGSRDVLHHPLGFDVLPAGSAASWKALERQPQIDGKLGDFVDAILDRYDLCQIDLAPASEIVLNSLEPSLSGTLLVIESGKHTLTEIQHRIAEHTVHTSPILGVILTDAPMPQLDLPHANPRARDGAPDRRYKVVRRSLVYAERKPQDPDSRMIKSPR